MLQPALTLDVHRYADAPVLAAVAERAVATTLVTVEGRALTEVTLWLRNRAQRYMKVDLPAGASIVSVDVAGMSAKPVECHQLRPSPVATAAPLEMVACDESASRSVSPATVRGTAARLRPLVVASRMWPVPERVRATIERSACNLVVLAGFMRILTREFVEHYAGRLINVHPSLLPSFTGLDTHRRALAEGVRIHGCTVHFVTCDLDHGPIVGFQANAANPHYEPTAASSAISMWP